MSRIYKYVTVDIRESVEARIEDNEIVDFLRQCDKSELKSILSRIKDAPISHEVEAAIPVSTMDDLLKMELFAEAFRKYTLTQLEEKLK